MESKDVIITGSKKDEAFKQLSQATSLKLKMDENGKVSAKGKAKTDADKKLLEAINDKGVVVKVEAENFNYSPSGHWFVGGSFQGSKVNSDGKVEFLQIVNPSQTKKIDKFYENISKGVAMLHEVLEAYVGAKKAPGTNSTTFNTTTKEFRAYMDAHQEVMKLDSRFRLPLILQEGNPIPIVIKLRRYPSTLENDLSNIIINDLKK